MKQCDQCQVVVINGVRCHETGCPVAWKDYKKDCFECGFEFTPESKYQTICADCENDDFFDEVNEFEEDEEDE